MRNDFENINELAQKDLNQVERGLMKEHEETIKTTPSKSTEKTVLSQTDNASKGVTTTLFTKYVINSANFEKCHIHKNRRGIGKYALCGY